MFRVCTWHQVALWVLACDTSPHLAGAAVSSSKLLSRRLPRAGGPRVRRSAGRGTGLTAPTLLRLQYPFGIAAPVSPWQGPSFASWATVNTLRTFQVGSAVERTFSISRSCWLPVRTKLSRTRAARQARRLRQARSIHAEPFVRAGKRRRLTWPGCRRRLFLARRPCLPERARTLQAHCMQSGSSAIRRTRRSSCPLARRMPAN